MLGVIHRFQRHDQQMGLLLVKLHVLAGTIIHFTQPTSVQKAQETVLFIKTLVTIEGVARALDPNLNVLGIAGPIVLKAITPKWMRLFWRR